MKHKIDAVEKGQYARLRISGRTNLTDLEPVTCELAALLRERGWSRILVDAREIKAAMSITDYFTHITRTAEVYPVGVRIAVWVACDDRQDKAFIETVARNRGISFRFFVEERAALEFLAVGRKPTSSPRGPILLTGL